MQIPDLDRALFVADEQQPQQNNSHQKKYRQKVVAVPMNHKNLLTKFNNELRRYFLSFIFNY